MRPAKGFLANRPFGESLFGKMKFDPVSNGRHPPKPLKQGFTLHMAQLFSLPCIATLHGSRLKLDESFPLHLAEKTSRGVRGV